MKLRIFAEDKPAEKVFEYQLELECVIILLCGVDGGELENQFTFMNSETKKRRREWRDI